MSFTLPELPYAYDALAPHMSRETLEFHHDKHHKAYVDNGNKLLVGSGMQGNLRTSSKARSARMPSSSTMRGSTTTTFISGSG